MIISFDQIPGKELPNFKGGEKSFDVKMMDAEDGNRFMLGLLKPGATIGMHTHETSSEVIYILSGVGKVLCEGVYEPLAPGACHYCPKGTAHSLINDSDGDLEFLAIVPEQ